MSYLRLLSLLLYTADAAATVSILLTFLYTGRYIEIFADCIHTRSKRMYTRHDHITHTRTDTHNAVDIYGLY